MPSRGNVNCVLQRLYTFEKGKSYVKLFPECVYCYGSTFATIVWSLSCQAYFWSYWGAAKPSLLVLLEHHLMDELGKIPFQQASHQPKFPMFLSSSTCSSTPLQSCTQLYPIADKFNSWLRKAAILVWYQCVFHMYRQQEHAWKVWVEHRLNVQFSSKIFLYLK